MSEQVIIVPGDPSSIYTCITAHCRPDDSHCWARASGHIMNDKATNYFTRLEAATSCRHMVEAILKVPKPPRHAPTPWGWLKGWPGVS